ncbi:MAG: (2Fe-2S) ferredoxin domain-containing protein [Tenuifilum sp.]|uniref:(2Fe-2S) ferredoxin domain-containing protein n=1 Tax=Tenuifilum TaxID=2760873 RepID=UPI001B7C4540|nr:(2Fe-2S) ferredoxin domain-containing protein [Bacteroidales bacterium]HOK60105.1 (2Fe-2S) ferredoxin domain-containing protein [Tenuifilum sp.]MBP9029479.1 (2Fe-2S) ferredoxin domain-containing protein [Bacteroidales bacterium]HOK84975.1 (2Fe-2S) ferredoxin domain-containing protein [Tenuifilum sp.]HON69532.1 (2Fe-2S) ferredoxin domain-containing protein [Tenuifilum sp.]
MSKRAELIICLGSSCFARGNKATLKAIMKFLDDHDLKDKVNFHGGHCFGNCAEGPNISINGKIYTGVDENGIIDILTNELL